MTLGFFIITQAQVIQPINGDPFVGSFETPVTSAPIVASFLSALPAYRTGVAPLLRGVEIGLTHGFLVVGPFIKVQKPTTFLESAIGSHNDLSHQEGFSRL